MPGPLTRNPPVPQGRLTPSLPHKSQIILSISNRPPSQPAKRFPIPKGYTTITRHFNAGSARPQPSSPAGTADPIPHLPPASGDSTDNACKSPPGILPPILRSGGANFQISKFHLHPRPLNFNFSVNNGLARSELRERDRKVIRSDSFSASLQNKREPPHVSELLPPGPTIQSLRHEKFSISAGSNPALRPFRGRNSHRQFVSDTQSPLKTHYQTR